MTKQDNQILMAVSIGKESSEGSFKMYQGVAALNIIGVNPDKSELIALTGRNIEEEPEYVGKTDEGKRRVRITFYGKTVSDAKVNNGIDLVVPFTFMLTEEFRVNSEGTKAQVIDKFGRTAWATKEEIAGKLIPQYASGPANISADYRCAFKGEAELIDFLIQWLNPSRPAEFKEGKWVEKPYSADYEVSLDIDALLKGNYKELQSLVKMAPKHVVKAVIGVRTVEGDTGTRQYHSVFTRRFLKNSVVDYSRIEADIMKFRENGGAPDTEFSVQPLHEYNVEPTSFIGNKGSEEDSSPMTKLPWE